MELFTRNTPAYKNAAISKQAVRPTAANWFSNLFGSLFGGAPSYKTVDGRRVTAPTSSGFWSLFGSSSPSYKTAPAMIAAPFDAEALDADASLGVDESLATDAEVGVDETGACAGPDQIVIL